MDTLEMAQALGREQDVLEICGGYAAVPKSLICDVQQWQCLAWLEMEM